MAPLTSPGPRTPSAQPHAWQIEIAHPGTYYRAVPTYGIVFIPPLLPRNLFGPISTIAHMIEDAVGPEIAERFFAGARYAEQGITETRPPTPEVAAKLWDLARIADSASITPDVDPSDALFLKAWVKNLTDVFPVYTVRPSAAQQPQSAFSLSTERARELFGNDVPLGHLVVVPGKDLFPAYVPPTPLSDANLRWPGADDDALLDEFRGAACIDPSPRHALSRAEIRQEEQLSARAEEYSFRVKVAATLTGALFVATASCALLDKPLFACLGLAGSLISLVWMAQSSVSFKTHEDRLHRRLIRDNIF